MMEDWNNGMMEWEVDGSRYNGQIFPYPLFQYPIIPEYPPPSVASCRLR
jgi:hypothetical protein